jgi:acetyltransferase
MRPSLGPIFNPQVAALVGASERKGSVGRARVENLRAFPGTTHLVNRAQLPKLALRPYPAQYVTDTKLRDGTPVTIRPIRPDDEPLLVDFHATLSNQTVYHRYFAPLKLEQRINHRRLSRVCLIDYDREMVLVVERTTLPGKRSILAVGRLSKLHDRNAGEFALLVSDPWQKHGVGTQLLRLLVQIGRNEKLDSINAIILPDNIGMKHVAKRLGFMVKTHSESGEVHAHLFL